VAPYERVRLLGIHGRAMAPIRALRLGPPATPRAAGCAASRLGPPGQSVGSHTRMVQRPDCPQSWYGMRASGSVADGTSSFAAGWYGQGELVRWRQLASTRSRPSEQLGATPVSTTSWSRLAELSAGCSAQYTTGPRCTATHPRMASILGSAWMNCGVTGRFKVTVSPSLQGGRSQRRSGASIACAYGVLAVLCTATILTWARNPR
jgi:hypothetical protein